MENFLEMKKKEANSKICFCSRTHLFLFPHLWHFFKKTVEIRFLYLFVLLNCSEYLSFQAKVSFLKHQWWKLDCFPEICGNMPIRKYGPGNRRLPRSCREQLQSNFKCSAVKQVYCVPNTVLDIRVSNTDSKHRRLLSRRVSKPSFQLYVSTLHKYFNVSTISKLLAYLFSLCFLQEISP